MAKDVNAMSVRLKRLSPDDGRDVYDMLQEIPNDENGFRNFILGEPYEAYRRWLAEEDAFSRSTQVVDGWRAPTTTFWLYDGDTPVGMGKLRHFLTDRLREGGGHVGYCVRPSCRGKGYSRLLLSALAGEARAMNLGSLLITVFEGNEPSLRTALSCGAKLERTANGRHYLWLDC